MIRINDNYLNLQDSYLFSTIAKKVAEFSKNNPDKRIIKLGIGDVTRPIVPKVIEAMHKAVDEMGNPETFKGYGPEQGYEFLREKIVKYDFESRGVNIDPEEIFVSDGAKSDCGNIGDILDIGNKVAITDPVYPVYLDSNIIAGRSKKYIKELERFDGITYLSCISENNFIPELPKEKCDMIYLCYPNNPTGTVLTNEQLKVWVDYARENRAIILFDSAYEKYITQKDIPHSIYEIEGAKEVAIEFRSFSKTAGFTGIRCAYTVVPKQLVGYTNKGNEISINSLWRRRSSCKFNGVSYITQRGAEAVYTKEAQQLIEENIKYYLSNANELKINLEKLGYKVYGGINSPYVWIKTPKQQSSWEFFDYLLEKANIVGTPGSGFGPSGEGYFRLTGFGKKEDTIEAIERIKKL